MSWGRGSCPQLLKALEDTPAWDRFTLSTVAPRRNLLSTARAVSSEKGMEKEALTFAAACQCHDPKGLACLRNVQKENGAVLSWLQGKSL